MTETLADLVAHWVARFEHDPELADELSDLIGELLERDIRRPTPRTSVLLMALGRWQESRSS